jgi:glycosyltransferase involved in cell wall biosynthesis
VIQEAVAAGLGVICTDECGAGEVFVQQHVNGFIVPTGNVEALAKAMSTFSESEDFLECVPNASIEISKRLLPSSFAETVIPFVKKKDSSSYNTGLRELARDEQQAAFMRER